MLRLRRRRPDPTKQALEETVSRPVAVTRPDDVASEAYCTLRTNLLYTLIDTPPKAIVVTSPGPAEGKSTTCANLGVVLAQANKNTLILDCDFRKPAMHKLFGLRNLYGVVDILVGERSLQEIWQEPLPGLRVGTAGSVPYNPAELLGSERFAELLNQARQHFDYILIDAPPTRLVSDPVILAAQADGVLLVIDAQNTRKGLVRQSIRSLETVGASVLGTVMNNVKGPHDSYYYRTYTYGHQ